MVGREDLVAASMTARKYGCASQFSFGKQLAAEKADTLFYLHITLFRSDTEEGD